jgi:hypothetical protein
MNSIIHLIKYFTLISCFASRASSFQRNALILTMGYCKEIFWNNKHLFEFQMFCDFGFKVVAGSNSDVLLSDHGVVKSYYFRHGFRGSGFGIRLCRKFHLNSWTKKLRKPEKSNLNTQYNKPLTE